MNDICLNCGKEHEKELFGANCHCEKPNVVHQLECHGCKNILGFVCDDDYNSAEKLYCHECLNKKRIK